MDMSGHFAEVGTRLGNAVESYNRAVGSLERRVLVSARRFQELKSTGTENEIEPVLPVQATPRELQTPQMTLLPESPSPSPEDQGEDLSQKGI